MLGNVCSMGYEPHTGIFCRDFLAVYIIGSVASAYNCSVKYGKTARSATKVIVTHLTSL